MSPPQYARSNSHGRRVVSGHGKVPLSKKSPTKTHGAGWSKSTGKQARSPASEEDEDDMGLPQYCATCEKQIVNPCASILYCSERCRKKDNMKPLSQAAIASAQSPPPITPRSGYFDDDSQDILPKMSPTVARPPSLAFSDSSESSISERRPSYHERSDSEASQYLSQFQSSTSLSSLSMRRPRYERMHSSSGVSAAPSLSNTPTSFASTAPSMPVIRPLPSRKNPYSVSFSSQSVDLVTPILDLGSHRTPSNLDLHNLSYRSGASTATAMPITEGEMTYEKKPYGSEASPGHGSLKQLFHHDAIKAPPKPTLKLPTPDDSEEGKDEEGDEEWVEEP